MIFNNAMRYEAYDKGSSLRGRQAFGMLKKAILPRLNSRKDFVVLDVASGDGKLLSGLLRPIVPIIIKRIGQGKKLLITRSDMNREYLVQYNEFNRLHFWRSAPGVKAKTLVCSADKINRPSGSVDLMFFLNALEHFDADLRSRTLKKAYQLLTKNGVLFVSGPVSSPWEKLKYETMRIFGLPRGPVNMDEASRILGWRSPSRFIVRHYHIWGLPFFKPCISSRIQKEIKNPTVAAKLLELMHKTPFVVDTRKDPDHKVWFSPASLKSELTAAGFKLFNGGEDYYVYGTTHGAIRMAFGSMIQSFMPFALRKFFAHGEIFICKKR